MGFFNSIFGGSSDGTAGTTPSNITWISLTNFDQLDTLVKQSWEHTVIIFKHSTRCSISRMALKQFEKEFDLDGKVTPYFLDLLEYRPISNEIASLFQVTHQSPQILVIKNGVCVYHASHSEIDAFVLHQYA